MITIGEYDWSDFLMFADLAKNLYERERKEREAAMKRNR